ncbi:MAG TPA: tRNA (guanosine(37)-N1)-methyltransferase TrmD [Anaerolineales bacterium]|nr:tRNA (guanosine(37)-N1)-methyltransferase TrmD [Anaerolineales bacterium]
MIRFDVFTLFPDIVRSYFEASVVGRAQQAALIDVQVHNIRDFTLDRHRTTDDVPYGGGGGMIMKPEPIFRAAETVLGESIGSVPVLLLTPQGRPFNHERAKELSRLPRLALLCGRYEGVDERVREHLATDEISIGDYVLTGGELPAMIVIDAVARLIPGVLGDAEAAAEDSHAAGLLEYPHYTRPVEFRGWRVPDVLVSGDHARIAEWRRAQSLRRTMARRPDMFQRIALSDSELESLEQASDDEADFD